MQDFNLVSRYSPFPTEPPHEPCQPLSLVQKALVGDAKSFQRLTPVRSKTRDTSTVQVDFEQIMLTTLLYAVRLAGVSA